MSSSAMPFGVAGDVNRDDAVAGERELDDAADLPPGAHTKPARPSMIARRAPGAARQRARDVVGAVHLAQRAHRDRGGIGDEVRRRGRGAGATRRSRRRAPRGGRRRRRRAGGRGRARRSVPSPCSRRRARLASWRVASGERLEDLGRPRRTARRTRRAARTRPVRRDRGGRAPPAARRPPIRPARPRARGIVVGRGRSTARRGIRRSVPRVGRAAPAAGRGTPARRPWSAARRRSRCARGPCRPAASRSPAPRRRLRRAIRASGRRPRAGAAGSPRTPRPASRRPACPYVVSRPPSVTPIVAGSRSQETAKRLAQGSQPALATIVLRDPTEGRSVDVRSRRHAARSPKSTPPSSKTRCSR